MNSEALDCGKLLSFSEIAGLFLSVSMYVSMCASVCLYAFVYIYVSLSLCVSVCMCIWRVCMSKCVHMTSAILPQETPYLVL